MKYLLILFTCISFGQFNPIFFNSGGIQPANTFIGGVSATINTPELLATKLGISSTRINNFKIVGSDIQARVIGGTYPLPASAFTGDASITYFLDNKSLVSSIGDSAFKNCTSLVSCTINLSGALATSTFENTRLTTVNLTNVTSIGSNCFAFVTTLVGAITANSCISISNGAFFNTQITSFSSTSCTSIANVAFSGCTEVLTYNFPALTTTTGGQIFDGNTKVTSIYMPSVTLFTDNTVNNNIFLNIKTGCSITVPVAMQTANAGAVEPDILYAATTRSAIITYI